ncbi:AAA family ATPase [Candidatus Falkowbacteria bacterium]|jgi:chromosome segregation protein|nr:AAA family ATPase [Candidatus Falkowbacteria bacterium]MBT4432765.1 AAA family ATPase [Candidatus Falkowbacteria bacterium]
MFLEKIEIRGFKSFANKTEFIFPEPEKGNKGITAVVGPNGSGKSNVVDAIRWVLGEQSLKLLRGKKSHDVIFHGAGGKSQLGMAEVSIFINNHDKVLPIEYSELMITRKLYRNGDSEYLLNKSKARLADITMLLAKANFGQKSFSIVGQGMIDYILQAGVKERKEFFDEAVGVKQYQIKRHRTINNLNRTKINLEQIKISLNELEPHLRLLSRQVKKLEKREKIKTELESLQIKHYSNLYFGLQDKITEINSELKNKKQADKEIGENFLVFQKELAILASDSSRSERFNELKEKFDDFNSEKNKLFKKLTIVQGEINLEYKKEGKLDLAWITRSKDDLILQENKIKNELELIAEEGKMINQKINREEKNLAEISQKINNLKLELEKMSEQTFSSDNKNWDELLQKIILKQRELIKQIELAKEQQDFQKIKNNAEKIKDNLKELSKKENNDYEVRVTQKINKIKEDQEDLLSSKNEILNKLSSLEINKNVNEEKERMIKSRIKEIKEELDNLKQEIKKNQVADQKTSLKELQDNEQKLNEKIREIDKKIKEVKNNLDNFNRQEQDKKDKTFSLQDKIQSEQIRLNRSKNEINEVLIRLTKEETRKEGLEKEIREEIKSLSKLNITESQEEIDENKIHRLKNQLSMIGGIDPETIEEHKEVRERYEFLSEQVEDMEESSLKLTGIIADLDKIIKNKFDESFSKINKQFNKYFKTLFDGGEAKLIKNIINIPTEDSDENEEENNEEVKEKSKNKEKQEIGIDIQAAPHGKKLKDIHILSGGEKSLTSIALICAIISINPSPFVILDEVDAALDEANSIRFAKILKDLSHKTQFITISHNRATMEVAKVLYGITMQEKGVSKVLSIKLEDAKTNAAR